MHFLVFEIEGRQYAMETSRIHRIVPCIPPQRLPHAPEEVAGLIKYRDLPVPVVDASVLLQAGSSPSSLSTRILLVSYPMEGEEEPRMLGLIAPKVQQTADIPDSAISPKGIQVEQAPFLGPVAAAGERFIQILRIEEILSSQAKEMLFSGEEPLLPE